MVTLHGSDNLFQAMLCFDYTEEPSGKNWNKSQSGQVHVSRNEKPRQMR